MSIYFYFSDRKHEESIKTYSIRVIRNYLKDVKCHKDELLVNRLMLNVQVHDSVTLPFRFSMCLQYSYEGKMIFQ